jgi:hypothetical protein
MTIFSRRQLRFTANYFTELGTPAALGRLFDPTRDGDSE